MLGLRVLMRRDSGLFDGIIGTLSKSSERKALVGVIGIGTGQSGLMNLDA